ncbi:PREDICTED: UDP-glucuronosyltransferase 2B2-like [Nicrophorus vespilloides]|uniref:UDP-glucuronosyltransferase n=1 Tax=Nicrophorus vespilloides TaxID=110193 RepID=A0ABM1NCZ5_NICVS|nr:PREDICTED: UDP-glucuronosyltransferase 2B2-like [Nicrophorus vespilloides]
MRLWEAVLLILAVVGGDGLKILGIFPFASYSHNSLGSKLMRDLAARNHQVTFISAFEEKNAAKNLRVVHMKGAYENLQEMFKNVNLFESNSRWMVTNTLLVHGMWMQITREVLEHPNTKKLLSSGEEFDLIVIEQFLNDAHKGFCHHYNAPCVIFSAVGTNHWTNDLVGNPSNPSYMPEMIIGHAGPMDFWQRVKNTAIVVYTQLFKHLKAIPDHDRLMHETFPDAPPLKQLIRETALVLLNSHPSITTPNPHVPNMIEIGGFHVEPPKSLPEDIKAFLDGAGKDGAIYFSMGSNLKSKSFPLDKREGIMKALSKLKMKVLWKFEDENLLGKPSNVLIKKWLPQQDVLAHPNVKLFISHGGLLSTIEAIYHGVPVLGIPVFGDQAMNMKHAVQNGFAVMTSYSTLSEDTFGEALNQILADPKYADNAKMRSRIMHDRPIKPKDSAMFWIEYIGRHGLADHLKSPAIHLKLHQVLLLDVIGFYLFVFIFTPLSIYYALKRICRYTRAGKIIKKKSK